MSPYMQELSVYAGHIDVYQRGAELIEKFLGVGSSAATIYRVTNHYGAAIEPLLYQPSAPVRVADEEVVYAEIDGSMIFTDQQWREVKLGRVFASDAIEEPASTDRGQSIGKSEYTAHLGTSREFCQKFLHSTEKYRALGARLVFLSDGARWISQWVSEQYPRATQILDFYHAVEYLAEFAQVSISDAAERSRWLAEQKALLLAGRLDRLIATVTARAVGSKRGVKEHAERVVGYYTVNRERMRYDEYIRRGLYIGSGAIESAHRTVVQRRMKLSGQRWSNPGAEHVLNLRACSLSGKWDLVENLIKHPPVPVD